MNLEKTLTETVIISCVLSVFCRLPVGTIAFVKVTQKDLLGWFMHCCYCTQQDWDTL